MSKILPPSFEAIVLPKTEELQNSSEFILKLNRNFSDEDKEKCIPIICKIIEFSSLARKQGILALEDEVAQEKNFLLKQGITLIVDGTDPALVKQILQNFILADNYTEFELLSRLIMLEGVLAIQQGVNPLIIELKMSSMLGEKYVPLVKEASERTEQRRNEVINNFLKEIADNEAFGEGKRLESELLVFDRASIQLIISEMVLIDFLVALHGCSCKLIQRILFELSTNLTLMIIEDWHNLDPVRKDYIILCQNRIIEKIEELKSIGRIISFRDLYQEMNAQQTEQQNDNGLAFVASPNNDNILAGMNLPLYFEDED